VYVAVPVDREKTASPRPTLTSTSKPTSQTLIVESTSLETHRNLFMRLKDIKIDYIYKLTYNRAMNRVSARHYSVNPRPPLLISDGVVLTIDLSTHPLPKKHI